MPDLVVLVTHNSGLVGRGPSDALEALQKRGSALDGFSDVDAYAAVLVSGKVVKEVIAQSGDARLGSEDIELPIGDFEIVSGKHASSITLGRYQYENRQPGILVVLYDPASSSVVFRATYPTARSRSKVWSDVAVRPR